MEPKIILQQAGFRKGKSTTGQLLNLMQHIEDGFKKRLVTGAAFVDLFAAYDTVNHRTLMTKIYQMTDDSNDNTLWYSSKEQDVLCCSESEEKLMVATAKWPPSGQCFSPVVL